MPSHRGAGRAAAMLRGSRSTWDFNGIEGPRGGDLFDLRKRTHRPDRVFVSLCLCAFVV